MFGKKTAYHGPKIVDRTSEGRELFYRRVYRQAFSPDGNWLIAAHSHKKLSLFSVTNALSPEAASSPYREYAATWDSDNPIFALKTVSSVLLCGDTKGRLYAYQWDELSSASAKLGKEMFCVNCFAECENVPPESEINAINALDERKVVCAGAGDNAVRLIDIERCDKVVSKYTGHKNYVNELAVRTPNEFFSASEDGTVHLWDARSRDSHSFQISAEPSLDRKCGHGVCALDVDDEFMVCGGDVDLGIWHVGSRALASPLFCDRPAEMRHTVAKIMDGKILTGGTCPYMLQFDFAAVHIASVQTSLGAIYTIEKNETDSKAMTAVAGQSHLINVFLNLGYIAFSFNTSKLPGDIFGR